MASFYERAVADARRACAPVDPVDAQLRQDAEDDHAPARARGRRVLDMADAAIQALHSEGLLYSDPDDCRGVLFHALAEALYGNAAIDIPPLRRGGL